MPSSLRSSWSAQQDEARAHRETAQRMAGVEPYPGAPHGGAAGDARRGALHRVDHRGIAGEELVGEEGVEQVQRPEDPDDRGTSQEKHARDQHSASHGSGNLYWIAIRRHDLPADDLIPAHLRGSRNLAGH